jgi:hypothetical protein
MRIDVVEDGEKNWWRKKWMGEYLLEGSGLCPSHSR